jgi:K+-transporting ATPase, C subunit
LFLYFSKYKYLLTLRAARPRLLRCPERLPGVAGVSQLKTKKKLNLMISNLFKSFKLTIAFCILFSVGYIFILWLFAQVASPNKGNADVVELNGRIVGAANVGQQFTKDIYFWGRPSHAGDGYDASSSAGSNKGPSNEEYLADVQARIDTFLVYHPYLKREQVPVEMVTASASGLDPDISPKAAYSQVQRVAKARGISPDKVMAIVNAHIEGPLLGLFGPEKVNVLKLNVALEKLERKD